jgi:tryptophan-rich sensory protein
MRKLKENTEKVFAFTLFLFVILYFVAYGASGHEFNPELQDIFGIFIFILTILFIFLNFHYHSLRIFLVPLLVVVFFILIKIMFYVLKSDLESFLLKVIILAYLTFCIYLNFFTLKRSINRKKSN